MRTFSFWYERDWHYLYQLYAEVVLLKRARQTNFIPNLWNSGNFEMSAADHLWSKCMQILNFWNERGRPPSSQMYANMELLEWARHATFVANVCKYRTFEMCATGHLKDPSLFEHYYGELGSDAREETLRFLEYIVFEAQADFRESVTSHESFAVE